MDAVERAVLGGWVGGFGVFIGAGCAGVIRVLMRVIRHGGLAVHGRCSTGVTCVTGWCILRVVLGGFFLERLWACPVAVHALSVVSSSRVHARCATVGLVYRVGTRIVVIVAAPSIVIVEAILRLWSLVG